MTRRSAFKVSAQKTGGGSKRAPPLPLEMQDKKEEGRVTNIHVGEMAQ